MCLSVYTPGKILTSGMLKEMVDTSDEWILTRSGIRERHIAADGEATSALALKAAAQALTDAGVAPEEVDLVIVATNIPDMLFPATACLVQEKIGAVHAGAFDQGAGCTGFIYATAVASQFISTGACCTVPVAGSECLSRLIN